MSPRIVTAVAIGVAFGWIGVPAAGATAPQWAPRVANQFDGRSPDTRDAALRAHDDRFKSSSLAPSALMASQAPSLIDGRSPDTKDAAYAASNPPATVVLATAAGFDWTDAGVGAAAGFGIATIAAAGLALTRSRRTLTKAT
jgi:hypothetical protein